MNDPLTVTKVQVSLSFNVDLFMDISMIHANYGYNTYQIIKKKIWWTKKEINSIILVFIYKSIELPYISNTTSETSIKTSETSIKTSKTSNTTMPPR